jgi:hypothetical protein
MGYGMAEAQKQQERTASAQQMSAQIAAQQANLQRAQAAGQMSGAQTTQAQGALAGASTAGAAQTERDIQARSQALAQQQHMEDQVRIDAQAQRAREKSKEQGAIIADQGKKLTDAMGAGGLDFDKLLRAGQPGAKPAATPEGR